MKLASLEDLFVEQLRDLHSAEKQLLKALPKMAKGASSAPLRGAFEAHLKQTEGHVERLEAIFQEMGQKPAGQKCKAMEGLIAEGGELLEADADPAVLDAALIAAAQRVEHYEMAGYGSAASFATILGHKKAAKLLQETLVEETTTDQQLGELAHQTVNPKAAHAAMAAHAV